MIEQVRAEVGAESVVVVDNGDTIQGTPLSYYYAKQQPITETGVDHPMAVAFNTVGYDAANVRNHEFNYDLPMLDAFRDDLDMPLLAANVIDTASGKPLLTPYTIVTRKPEANKPIRVGILGLTVPGSMIWDKAYLLGLVGEPVDLRPAEGPGQWNVTSAEGVDIPVAGHAPLASVVEALTPYHQQAVAYVNQVIATSVSELPASESRYRDTAIIDYIQMVQTDAVRTALAGSPQASLPIVSIAAPFSRTAVFPKGDVTIRDMAGLYIYDNTLQAVTMTGAQLDDYLEFSAQYFRQVTDGTFDPATDTNAEIAPGRTQPDYNYDIAAGVTYTIDLTRPVGSRVTITTNADGSAFDPAQTYVVVVNNYRRSGGGGFPHIAAAPVVYDQGQEIRQLLIDWAVEHKVIDPADFFVENWWLTLGGTVIYP